MIARTSMAIEAIAVAAAEVIDHQARPPWASKSTVIPRKIAEERNHSSDDSVRSAAAILNMTGSCRFRDAITQSDRSTAGVGCQRDHWRVGTNRRYPQHASQLAEQRELRDARAKGPLQTLTDAQLRLGTQVLSIAPERAPMWARAWLRFGDVDLRCTVRVRRWTADAVGVEVDVDGEALRCWVWQGACNREAGLETQRDLG